MKKQAFIMLLALLAVASCGSGNKERDEADGKAEWVYICTGPKSKAYHSTPDCKGLRRCSAEVEKVGKAEAEELGRRPCRICM